MAAPTIDTARTRRAPRAQRGPPELAPQQRPRGSRRCSRMATVFFLWPMINVVRLAFTNTTLLRDDYTYTLQTFAQTLTDPSLPSVLVVTVDLRRRLGGRAAACSAC